MLTQIQKSDQDFHAYYHDNSVLIQFVLAEFIMTHQLASQIKQCAQATFPSNQNSAEFVSPLFQQLNQLLGTAVNKEKTSASRWTRGPLTKLKNYCEQFTLNSQHRNKRHVALYTYVHQAWLSAIHNVELLSLFQQTLHVPVATSMFSSIKRALTHLDQRLNNISKQIARILGSYQDNENVLFFILRWKDPLSKIYGADFITHIFKCFFQTDQVSQLLIQRYLKRGFEHLLPLIQESAGEVS